MMRAEPAAAVPHPTANVDPVDRLIGRLYRGGLAVPPDGFRRWALEALRTVVPFDAAIWGTGTARRMKFHTCTVLNLPAGFPEALEASQAINPIVPALLRRIETPVDMRSVMPDPQFYSSDLYRRTFAPCGIERILSTGHVDSASGLYSLVTLYRFDRRQVFGASDAERVGRVMFHLFNAASHAFFLQMSQRLADRPSGSAAAAVDATGAFHDAMPRFFDMLDRHFPDRPAQALPFALPADGETVVSAGLCIRCEPLDELRCVHIWPAGPLDHLTRRERDVVTAIAHGLSFKQAAKRIGIAPSTVANHLYRVYRKLGVYSRAALAELVYPETRADAAAARIADPESPAAAATGKERQS